MNDLDLIAQREEKTDQAQRARNETPEQKYERIVSRVAKLLRQSEDAAKRGEENEQQAYHIRAFELMAQYGVDEAQARERDDKLKNVKRSADSMYVRMEGKYLPLQADMFYQLAGVMHCTSYTVGGRKGKVTQRVYGVPDHLKRLMTMWELLQPQFMRGMQNAEPPFGYSDSGELRTYRRNWVRGFVAAVCERIRKAEYDAANGAGALVLYRGDLEVAETQMYAETPGLRKTRTYAHRNGGAYKSGHQAGQAAQLHRGIQ